MNLRATIAKFIFNRCLPTVFCWWILFSAVAHGEKMPLKHLTTNDGLPQNTINKIIQDRKGFFWIGTNGGLARFDGYEFVNFTKANGLLRNEVSDIVETGMDGFWLATSGGLVKFNPEGKVYDRVIMNEEASQMSETPMFITYPVAGLKYQTVSKLLLDSRGTIWVGTQIGLFQLQKNADQFEFLPVNINLSPNESYVHAIYEDRASAIWIGTNNNLTRISNSNHITTYRGESEKIEGQAEDKQAVFSAMLEDRAGNFWVGTWHQGLFQFSVKSDGTPEVIRQFSAEPDSELEWIDQIVESADGALWIGGNHGIYEFEPKENKLFRYTRASGLGYYRFRTLFHDGTGNLWLGTGTNGIYRLSTQGLISFELEDRISFVRSVGLDNEKNLLLTAFVTNTELDEKGARVEHDIAGKTTQTFEWRLGKLSENGFSWLVPKFPKPIAQYGSGRNQLSFQARSSGEWWIVTGEGLFRFPKVEFEELDKTAPINVFNVNSGLKPANVFRIFEDSRGNVWIATSGTESNGFYKWERKSETLRDMKLSDNADLISSFAEDNQGNIWFSFFNQGFARLSDGKIDFWNKEQGVPPGGIISLFFDRENRLWLAARQGGVLRIDEPQAEPLRFINYTETSGLSSNRTLSLTQDKSGFIYIGTDRDINRLNPDTGEFKRLNLAKNQLQREYTTAICDENGTLWFGATEGLVKYVPQTDKPLSPPEILVLRVQIEGVPQNVSAQGTTELNLPTLDPQQNQVRVDYVSLSNFENEDVTYQYKFAEDADWSAPGKERFVNFANLSAGNYHVLIRAVASGETFSENPAVVSFRILPPIYLRWWFIAFSLLLAGAVVYAFYRYRVQQLLEVERARTLIATDLHDDIGSNLSKISVLSEVVRMQMNNENSEQNRLLNLIAETSRQSVSSMSDIVWAINPKRDSLLEMVRKMREHAEEILVPKNIHVKFTEPEAKAKIKLPMHLRRDLYLIFKEAVNNIAQHADCTKVVIDFKIEHHEIVLKIEDNGIGFDRNYQISGNGLANMQTRVEKLKGTLNIDSDINHGTMLLIHIPQK